MNGPIRDMAGLLEAVRRSQIERDISYSTLEAIAGLASGTIAKHLGPNPSKKLGPLSTFLILSALGKRIAIEDDPEMIERVQSRWDKRNIVGGSAIQLRKTAREQARSPSPSTSLSTSAQMQALRKLVKRESLVKAGSTGGKRRAKRLKAATRQRIATHAARTRWKSKTGKSSNATH